MDKIEIVNPYKDNPYKGTKKGLHEIVDLLSNKAQTVFWRIWTAFEEGFKEGVQADREAVVKWLWEPCTEHPTRMIKFTDWYSTPDDDSYPDHRYQCPDCMKEFKEV